MKRTKGRPWGWLLGAGLGLGAGTFLLWPKEPPKPGYSLQSQPSTESQPAGFDDHTRARLPSREALLALAAQGVGQSQEVKFLLRSFGSPERQMVFLDGSFYKLHDEWFWFRLLNGQPVEGGGWQPVKGPSFSSIQEVHTWASQQKELPLDLYFVEDSRLYSPSFYAASLTEPRGFGLGTLMHFPARTEPKPQPERWIFELEYNDPTTYEDLVVFFKELEKSLPPEVGPKLLWVVRSPHQEIVARKMEEDRLPYSDRILRYSELAVPGEVEVYSPGITAGHLRLIEEPTGLPFAFPTDILVLPEVPDWLPPGSGLVSSVPQTPLAHINILARNRGIPNAYRGGILEDPLLYQLASGYAPVVIRAEAPHTLEIHPISEEQLQAWQELRNPSPLSYTPPEIKKAPNTIPLEAYSLSEVSRLRPIIGGKAAGFLALLAPGSITRPEHPLVITIKPYAEHLAPLRTRIEALLADYEFAQDDRARYLALEGVKRYDARYPGPANQQYKEAILARAKGDPIADLARDGGLTELITDQPIAQKTLADIQAALEQSFGHYTDTQGLRFRSSSTIEDIEGFNGAGLYESFTGYLHPEAQPDKKDQKRSVEWALKRTWASYWGFEAFEERRIAEADHLSGNMAVVVHARFEDEKEVSNGVFTFTLLPPGGKELAILELNAQKGAESVTNPTLGSKELPEVSRLVLSSGEEAPRIERLKTSTMTRGAPLLSDEALRGIFAQAKAVTEAELSERNRDLPAARAGATLTLDFEFREVSEGWPQLRSGEKLPQRVVLKQARSLDPGLRRVPELFRQKPIPRHILVRASKINKKVYRSAEFSLTALEVFTDPLLSPDLGYSAAPFTAEISLEILKDLPALGLKKGQKFALDHGAFSASHPGMSGGGSYALALRLPPEAGGLELELQADGGYLLRREGGESRGGSWENRTDILFTTPEEYLLGLIRNKK
jgi:hypothetical protein